MIETIGMSILNGIIWFMISLCLGVPVDVAFVVGLLTCVTPFFVMRVLQVVVGRGGEE